MSRIDPAQPRFGQGKLVVVDCPGLVQLLQLLEFVSHVHRVYLPLQDQPVG
jgi:hypothetical protein